jgi:hypothetical protein
MRFVNTSVVFVEIGVAEGGSLQMWKRFLGPYAQIVGLDIARKRVFEEEQIAVRIGDQSDPRFLQSVLDEFGAPDIVLDDGGHVMSQVTASFDYLYSRMSPTGVYVVEDVHTAYWETHGGGLRAAESFIEKSKSLIDELNADHTRGALSPTSFTASTLSMHFYDSMVVFERGRLLLKHAPKTGRTRGTIR